MTAAMSALVQASKPNDFGALLVGGRLRASYRRERRKRTSSNAVSDRYQHRRRGVDSILRFLTPRMGAHRGSRLSVGEAGQPVLFQIELGLKQVAFWHDEAAQRLQRRLSDPSRGAEAGPYRIREFLTVQAANTGLQAVQNV